VNQLHNVRTDPNQLVHDLRGRKGRRCFPKASHSKLVDARGSKEAHYMGYIPIDG
jgi:hypothetical protein